jgi:hypothetical protein
MNYDLVAELSASIFSDEIIVAGTPASTFSGEITVALGSETLKHNKAHPETGRAVRIRSEIFIKA